MLHWIIIHCPINMIYLCQLNKVGQKITFVHRSNWFSWHTGSGAATLLDICRFGLWAYCYKLWWMLMLKMEGIQTLVWNYVGLFTQAICTRSCSTTLTGLGDNQDIFRQPISMVNNAFSGQYTQNQYPQLRLHKSPKYTELVQNLNTIRMF